MTRKKSWKIGGHNGLLSHPNGGIEHRPELEKWLRVVYHDGPSSYEEFAVAAGDAARLAKLLNRVEPREGE